MLMRKIQGPVIEGLWQSRVGGLALALEQGRGLCPSASASLGKEA